MPEEKEESQDNFGWEDLTNQDDGTRDMGEPIEVAPKDPEPTPPVEQAQPTETPPEAAPEPTAPAAEPTEQAAETPEGEEKPTPEEPVYTLHGGKKVTQAELAADPDLLAKLVLQSNQVSDSQRIAKERKDKVEELEAANRQLLDQYTAWDMQQKLIAQQPEPAAPPQRPDSQTLAGIYSPHLDKLVADGRLTADQRSEFGNVVSEYMYDQQNSHNMIGAGLKAIADEGNRRLGALESKLGGEVVPDIERRQQQDVAYWDQSVQNDVASRPGYEALAKPEEWNRLKLFIEEKMNASPKNAEGKPTFDPMFDGNSMAQMFDAMTGAETRAALTALKAAQAATEKQNVTMAGGETAARAGTPPIKKPSKMTPEQEAMDFSDPSMATG